MSATRFGTMWLARVIWVAALGACGDDTGGAGFDASAASVELGTSYDAFVPLDEDGTLRMERGPQGGQHVWLSLRARGIPFDGDAITRARLVRARDGYEDAIVPFTVRVRVEPTPGTDYTDVTGLRIFVAEPEALLGEALELQVDVRHTGGAEVVATHPARVEWGDTVTGPVPRGG